MGNDVQLLNSFGFYVNVWNCCSLSQEGSLGILGIYCNPPTCTEGIRDEEHVVLQVVLDCKSHDPLLWARADGNYSLIPSGGTHIPHPFLH